ncbi:MAG: GPR endopeptidase [Eubacterium sp.]|nr:GPR endopeptidase [Eubacterium sp.]MDD6568661.1 GPR endopeptidase [Eubacteriales bacterium]MDY4110876.1 GPR endopeptidase [Eubacterium sp.]
MENRTDLAVESYENGGKTVLDGVKVEENDNVTTVTVFNENGAAALGKGIGKYITYCTDTALDDSQIFDGRLDELSKILSSLLPKNIKSVLVAGLGNTDITADALGPKTVNYVLATRHIINDYNNDNSYFSDFFNVSSISTGVLGDTGIESAEIIKGVVNQIKPDCVIAVDALAASSSSRLGNTVQLSDVGISPGSGVGNHRYEISESTLGVPVVSIGIPTVVSTSVIRGKNDNGAMFVTPREIDRIIEHGAKLIAMTVNVCLQKNIDAKDLFSLVG